MKIFRAALPHLAVSLRSRAKLKSPLRRSRSNLLNRVGDQLGHVLRPEAAQIDNLVTATRSRSNHDVGMLIVDLAKQIGRDLFREFVFLGQRSECACHSAAT